MESNTNHLPDAGKQADAVAAAEAAAAAEAKARDARRSASIKEVVALGKQAAQGSVALMVASKLYQSMVRAGDADAKDDAKVWYQAFAKGWNGFDAKGLGETADSNDSDAVSRWRTFAGATVLAVTARYADFYERVLVVRKSLESEERDSTYNSLLVANRKVRDWFEDTGKSLDELFAALDTDFESTVTAWLRKGKAATKSVEAKLRALVDSLAKIAKREKSDTLDAATILLGEAVTVFAAELQSKAEGKREFELLSAERASSKLNVGGKPMSEALN